VTFRFDGSARLRQSRAAGVLTAAAVLAGCRDKVVAQDAAQPPAVDASIAATAPPPETANPRDASPPPRQASDSPSSVVRTRGEISAWLAPEKAKYALGEPMLVAFEVSNTGRETLLFDDRSWRYTWIVRSKGDEVLCDSGRRQGRLVSEYFSRIRIDPGETYRERYLLNAVCGAFAEAGRYLVSVRRSLSPENDLYADPACDDLDPRQRGAGAANASSRSDPACADARRASPAVTSRFSIEIAAWDAAALRARLATFVDESRAAARGGDKSREGALPGYGYWFCDHVRCDCPPLWNRYGDWLEKAIARVPEQMGAGCRRR
jgi:hypothetical protein